MRTLTSVLARTALAATLVAGSVLAAQAEVVFHRGNTGEPETLDQHRTSTTYEANILQDLYEGLVIYDAAGSVIAGSAESWTISDDGREYTFTIREDAKWSNGDPVTADDFVYSLKRILDPATGAKYANILYPIENAEGVNTGDLQASALGVAAPSDRTLVITLSQATPYFLELLTHQTGLPVHPSSVERHGDDFVKPGNMVSNGPFVLTEVAPQAHVLAVKNEFYHDADNVEIDKVYYYPIEDRSTALRRFQAGEIHSNNDVPSDQIAWLKENMPDEFRNPPRLGTYYYALDHRHEAVGDPRVRQALSMAIDREFIVEEITGGGEVPANSFVPPGTGNYGEPAFADFADMSMVDREDRAIELLTEAGYGPDNPITLELRYNTSENHKKVALAIADMWAPLGVNVELLNTDVATHYAYLRDGGAFAVARAGWIGDYNDPQNFLFMVESDNDGFNYAQYDNAEYDGLMDQAAATIDLDARADVLKRAEELFMRDLPFIPIYHYVNLELVSTKIEGWEDNIQGRHPSQFVRITN